MLVETAGEPVHASVVPQELSVGQESAAYGREVVLGGDVVLPQSARQQAFALLGEHESDQVPQMRVALAHGA
ncbi:hypothetical protein M2160_002480 [Streptomyces sp. SAI-117]|nr:hypothetical protein [Streptomyces sp. SAI-117]